MATPGSLFRRCLALVGAAVWAPVCDDVPDLAGAKKRTVSNCIQADPHLESFIDKRSQNYRLVARQEPDNFRVIWSYHQFV